MIRHSRAEAFEKARSGPAHASRWTQLGDDPNHPDTLAHRERTLRAAWRPPIDDRIEFLEDRCRDRVVLDIGCVAHSKSRLESDDWLHGRLARVADRCLGVDVLEEGVAAVVKSGYDAVVHDLTGGLGPLDEWAPFDVIVAGELLEHVTDLDMIFRVAAETLAADGQLIMTTPNPYAPERVRAGQQGLIWENADHVSYLFPSGVAELAERRGLRLVEAATIATRRAPATPLQQLKRTIRGSHWRNVGFDSTDDGNQASIAVDVLSRALARLTQGDDRFLGETFAYVVGRTT